MNTIRIRVWLKDKGFMLYPDSITFSEGTVEVNYSNNLTIKKKETEVRVMAFLGACDKLNNPIYEDDIITWVSGQRRDGTGVFKDVVETYTIPEMIGLKGVLLPFFEETTVTGNIHETR